MRPCSRGAGKLASYVAAQSTSPVATTSCVHAGRKTVSAIAFRRTVMVHLTMPLALSLKPVHATRTS